MKRMVNHKQIYRNGPFGGTINTTLCGRVDNRLPDGMNVDTQVTCKFCIKIIERQTKVKGSN